MISGTFLLYISILISTTLLVTKAQRTRKNGSISFSKTMLIMSFIIHWVFIAFTRIGADHDQYCDIIMRWAELRLARGEEPGSSLMCIILRNLTGDPERVIFIFKTITICVYYQTFWLLRERANIIFVIFSFNRKTNLRGFTIIG